MFGTLVTSKNVSLYSCSIMTEFSSNYNFTNVILQLIFIICVTLFLQYYKILLEQSDHSLNQYDPGPDIFAKSHLTSINWSWSQLQLVFLRLTFLQPTLWSTWGESLLLKCGVSLLKCRPASKSTFLLNLNSLIWVWFLCFLIVLVVKDKNSC